MANALKCDRCGKCYTKEELFNEFDLTDVRWRYSLHYDLHPYPEKELDLCSECLKSLYSWLNEKRY